MFQYSYEDIRTAINNGVNNYLITNTNALNGLDPMSSGYQARMARIRKLIANLGKNGYDIPILEDAIAKYLDNNLDLLPHDRALDVDKLTKIMPTLLDQHLYIYENILAENPVDTNFSDFVEQIFAKELENDPYIFSTNYTKDKEQLLPLMVAGDFTLIYNEENREFFLARDYDIDSREYSEIESFGCDIDGLNKSLDEIQGRAELTGATFITFGMNVGNEELDSRLSKFDEEHEGQLLIYKIPVNGEYSMDCFVKAQNLDTALDIVADKQIKGELNLKQDKLICNVDDVEVCTIEDIPDGDVLFDEDGSPMEAIDAKALVSNKAKGSRQSLSSNIKQSIYSGKVEKIQNKEQEYSEKRLHEREISRDERFGDTDYNVDSPY